MLWRYQAGMLALGEIMPWFAVNSRNKKSISNGLRFTFMLKPSKSLEVQLDGIP